MNPTDNLGFLLQHITSTLARQSDQILLEQLGLGYSQFKIMLVLESNSGARQRHIADLLGQTEASISRQVKLMHRDGLLETTINPRNRREHLTSLTSKGLRYIREATSILNRYHAPVFAALSEKQQAQLAEILSLMHQEVCKGTKSSRCFQGYLD